MKPIRAIVNQTAEHRVATPVEADILCDALAGRPVFTANAYSEEGYHPQFHIIVESGRALVFFMDMARQVKLVSRDQACIVRRTVSLRNDEYPDLAFDLIEVPQRSLISPVRALEILRHYLKTGEPIDLVPWPAPDEAEWYGELVPDSVQPLDETEASFPGEEIPF